MRGNRATGESQGLMLTGLLTLTEGELQRHTSRSYAAEAETWTLLQEHGQCITPDGGAEPEQRPVTPINPAARG